MVVIGLLTDVKLNLEMEALLIVDVTI